MEYQKVSQVSQALSHPARIFIAEALWKEGPKYVQDLEKCMPLVQASISHHLGKLREIDLIGVEEHRLFNQYYLNKERLDELAAMYERWFLSFREGRGFEL